MRLVLLCCFFAPLVAWCQPLTSPDGTLELSIDAAGALRLSEGENELFAVATGVAVDGKQVARGRGRQGQATTTDRQVRTIVPTKSTTIREHYREITVSYPEGVELRVRLFDNGLAYRYTGLPAGRLTGETYDLKLDSDTKLFYPKEESFYSHNERTYQEGTPADFDGLLASLPTLAILPSGHHLWLSEANLRDYPGLWITASKDGLRGTHPPRPKDITDTDDRTETYATHEDLGILEAGARTPWRVFGVSPDAAGLLDDQLVHLLSEPATGDFSWVHPGQVAWDWYNALNLKGVDFEAGINTASYKYFIDFAAEHDVPYIILDEGWSPTMEVTTVVPEIDLESIIAYGEERGVGVILWVLWKPFFKDLEAVCQQYADWDVRGVKVDFIQRDDQPMVQNYWRMAEVAAHHELLVDFHGSYKPAGLHRTYPNVITREGLKGLEWNKFGNENSGIGPDHNCILPFIRQVAGPMDFTPGAMANAQLANHHFSFQRPVSMGTRTHQLAMYVVYESPLQMLSDSPTAYEAEPVVTDFVTTIPTVWQRTVPIAGKVGDYVAVARQATDGDWYLGAINDWDARELTFDLNFLPPGDYRLESFRDGPNHERHAEDYTREVLGVRAGQTITLPLGKGGGWVGRFRRR